MTLAVCYHLFIFTAVIAIFGWSLPSGCSNSVILPPLPPFTISFSFLTPVSSFSLFFRAWVDHQNFYYYSIFHIHFLLYFLCFSSFSVDQSIHSFSYGCVFKFYKFTYWSFENVFIGKVEKYKDRERLPYTDSLPERLLWLWPELHPNLPRGFQGPNCLSHKVLLPRRNVSRKLTHKSWCLNRSTLIWEKAIPQASKPTLKHAPLTHIIQFLKKKFPQNTKVLGQPVGV